MEKQKKKVLLVDDEKIVRDFLSRLLSLQGLEVVCVEDGLKAIELSKTNKFDFYFLDVRMPNLNGLQTLQGIRKINPQARIIMMSGYAVEGILEEAQKEGILGSIRKPFDICEIKKIMDSAIIEKKENLRVLVVDDDEAILKFFEKFLMDKNVFFKSAKDKAEAISASKNVNFDLVLLDLFLKDQSGIDVYKEIKKIIPKASVIIMTGFPQKAEEVKDQIDIAGCLYKPFEIEKVIEWIDKLNREKKCSE